MKSQIEDPNTLSTKSKWTFWLILAAVTTTFGASLPVGYNIGVINAPADIIKAFCNESVYTRYGSVLNDGELEILWSTVVSIFLVGGVTGSLTGSWLADRVGRKGAYVVSALLNVAGGVMLFCVKPTNSVELLLFGRILIGLAAGLITCVVPMYLTELSPLSLRGSMGVLCPLGITFGVLIAQIAGLQQIFGTETLWPTLLAAYVILVVICGLVIPVLPESPKYLYVVKKQPQLALNELTKLRGLPASDLSQETYDLQLAQRQDEHSGVSWNLGSVLKNKELLLPILLVCAMQAGQQLSGINAVFYYSVSIFKSTGLSDHDSQLANIGCGCVNLLMAIVAVPLNSKYNRRTLFLLSTATAAFWLILLGFAIYFQDSANWLAYVSIVSILSYVLFYGLGLGPIPYFVGSELFDVGPRPSAMALGSMANWGANFVIGMTFPTMQRNIGPWSFMIFGGCTIALFFFIRFYLPETRGKDPSEIAILCKDGFRSRPLDAHSTDINATSFDIKI